MSRTIRTLLLLALLVIAAALRLWQIDVLPPGFHFDESFEGLEAWRILTDPHYRPIFLMGNFGVPPLNAYANAGMFALFRLFDWEVGPTAMRTTAALFGVLGVAAVYALATELRRLDERIPAAFPLLAAAALAVMRWHIHFSRMGIEPIMVPAWWAATFWLLLRGWRTGSWLSFGASGIILGMGMYTYQGAWVIPLLVIVAVVHLALWDRERVVLRWRGVMVAAAVSLLAVIPLLLFFSEHPALLLLRPGQIATVGEGSVAGGGDFVGNIIATAKMFIPFGETGDLDPRRNLPGAPALNLWLALPFFWGLIVALWRIRNPAYGLIIVGLVGLLLPGVFSEYAPHFHRILGAAAPTALLVGLGLVGLGQMVGKGFQRWGWERFGVAAATAISLLLLILGGITSANNYFQRWAALPDLFHAFDEGLWLTGQWIADQPSDMPIYLSPRSNEHPTLAFAWTTRPRPAPASYDGRHVFPLSDGAVTAPEAYVVIEHEDFRTRLLLPEVFPTATTGDDLLDDWGELYRRIYFRPPQSVPKRQPQHPFTSELGDGIRLLGYDINPSQPVSGGILYLQLHWIVDATPVHDWTVATHLLGEPRQDGSTLWAGHDSIPGNGSLPTTRWQAGWRILDEYQMQLPSDLPPGEYELEISLYQQDGEHLPATADGLRLGTVQIVEP